MFAQTDDEEGGTRVTDEFDLGVIIPLEEEYLAIADFAPVERSWRVRDETFYEIRLVGHRLVAIVVGEMGQEVGAIAAERLQAMDIHMLAVVGVAGSLSKDVRLGDVVVPRLIDLYGVSAKARPAHTLGGFQLARAGEPYRIQHAVSHAVSDLKRRPESRPALERWRARCAVRRVALGLESSELRRWSREFPEVHQGHLASGSEVSASSEFGAWLLERDRSYLAIEMESGGVSASADRKSHTTPLLVLRGVSDFADDRKSEFDNESESWPEGAWRRYACQNAFDLLGVLLSEGALPLDRAQPEHTSPELRTVIVRSPAPTWQLSVHSETVAQRLARQAEFDRGGPGRHAIRAVLLCIEALRRTSDATAERTLRRLLAILATPKLILQHSGWVDAVTFSADGGRVLTASGDHSASLWDAVSGSELGHFEHDDWVGTGVISHRGDWVATGSDDGTARIWDTSDGRLMHTFLHESWVRSIAVTSDQAFLVTGSGDGTAAIWEIESEQEVTRIRTDGWIRWVAVSEDDRYVAAGSDDGTARIFDLTTRSELPALAHEGGVRCVQFSGDSSQLATGSDDRIARVWGIEDSRERCRFQHEGSVGVVVFSPDGQRLLTASDDHSGCIVDARTGGELVRLQHEDVVWCAAFAKQGDRVATGSDDHTARVWDASTGEELNRIVHADAVGGLAFSPDGTSLATASDDGTGRVWSIPSGGEVNRLRRQLREGSVEELLEAACGSVTRNLTREEWLEYVGVDPYQPTCPNVRD
jgi:WD40 repeat protein/nucleoside phosphorylase